MRLIILRYWVFLTLAFLSCHAAQAARRVALVIGNSQYEHAPLLPNPKNDANAIAAALARLNFEVVRALDVTHVGTAEPISKFVSLLDGADVGLFYYAGHGLSYETRNYLVPVDAKVEDHISVKFQMTPIDEIVDEMAKSVRLSIIVLDACRDNPFAARLARSLGKTSRSASVGRGLSRMQTNAQESFIFFATAPDDVAADGSQEHSPFTTALLNHIERENVTIEDVLRGVRRDVREATDGAQLPEGWIRLEHEFQFRPSGPDTQLGPQAAPEERREVDQDAEDRLYWESVRNMGDAGLLQTYIDRFPKGKYGDIARKMIAKLSEDAAVKPAESPKVDADNDYQAAINAGTDAALQEFIKRYPNDARAGQLQRTLAERSDWAAALSTDTQAAYERYLLSYPSGTYAVAARDHIANLMRQNETARTGLDRALPAPTNSRPTQNVLPSFNCQENTAPAEQAICRQGRLAQLDLDLAQAYAVLFGRLSKHQGIQLRDSQRTWLKDRNACQWDERCIEDRYLTRLEQLRAWGG